MIIFRIHHLPDFAESNENFFKSLLEEVQLNELLSPTIFQIVITDHMQEEIDNYYKIKNSKTKLTQSRGYKSIAKTIDFDGKKSVYFDANYIHVNSISAPQIFYEQLIEIYAEEIIRSQYNVPESYTSETPLSDILKMFFLQWSTKSYASIIEKKFKYQKYLIYSDTKLFADSFKRNVRKLHYQYQQEINLASFWINILHELDVFIRLNQDVNSDHGDFKHLQEFGRFIIPLLSEIDLQTTNLINQKEINFSSIHYNILEILKICFIDIPCENPMTINIIDTPKRLFKGSLIDTEPRIVAFMDILGFSKIIEEYENDSYSNILDELHDTLENAVKVSIENMTDSKVKSDLTEFLDYRMFSDCICISLPYIEFGNDFHIQFQSLTTIVKSYQLAMMQKGFFVRGGISCGSYYSDKNMIFSGGLVNAYKLEKTTNYPVIEIDKIVLERLNKNFTENTEGLFIENSLVFSSVYPEKMFINPFEILDNANNYFQYIQSTLSNLIEDESLMEDKLARSVLTATYSFANPIFEFAKSQMTQENILTIKKSILDLIEDRISKQLFNLNQTQDDDAKIEIKRIIEKLKFLHQFTEWSMGKLDSNAFKNVSFTS